MRLLVLDVEGTIFDAPELVQGASIPSTMWQGIAAALGPDAEAEEAATHQRQAAGDYASYIDWMVDTVEIHRRHGLTKEIFDGVVSSARYNPGVESAINGVDRSRYRPVLISGGFRDLTVRAQRDLGVMHAFSACDYLFRADGMLETYNLMPFDFKGKVDLVHLLLRELGLGSDDWVFVGDGENDVPMAQEAPLSVAYGVDTVLAAVADHRISHFDELLPLLRRPGP